MQYILTAIYTTYNVGSVTEEFTFDEFYDMQEYIINNSEQWDSYRIDVK